MNNQDLPCDLRDKADPHKAESPPVQTRSDTTYYRDPWGKCPRCGVYAPAYPIALCPWCATPLDRAK